MGKKIFSLTGVARPDRGLGSGAFSVGFNASVTFLVEVCGELRKRFDLQNKWCRSQSPPQPKIGWIELAALVTSAEELHFVPLYFLGDGQPKSSTYDPHYAIILFDHNGVCGTGVAFRADMTQCVGMYAWILKAVFVGSRLNGNRQKITCHGRFHTPNMIHSF